MTLADFRSHVEARAPRRNGMAGSGGLDTHEYPQLCGQWRFSTDRTIAGVQSRYLASKSFKTNVVTGTIQWR